MVCALVRLLVLLVALAGCASRGSAPRSENTPARGRPRIELGDQRTLLDNGALGLAYFPDMGTSMLERQPATRLILTALNTTYLVEGADVEHLTSASAVLTPGAAGSFDNGYAGVSAVVDVKGELFGFYHAEDHVGLPPVPGGIPGYFASIALATSSNAGKTWQKRGQVITSSQPKTWEAYPNQGDRGSAEPGAVLTRDGAHVLLYYTEHSRVEGRGVDICVARAALGDGPPLPGSFKKFHQGAFSEPGIGGKDTPIVTAKGFSEANALEAHVTWSETAQRYLMVLGIDAYRERMAGEPPRQSGLYAAWSADGVAWSELEPLFHDQAVPQSGMSLSWEGSVLWDDPDGAQGWLVYGHTPSWGTTPHYMVGRRVQLVFEP